jgi:hypothetical protein
VAPIGMPPVQQQAVPNQNSPAADNHQSAQQSQKNFNSTRKNFYHGQQLEQ